MGKRYTGRTMLAGLILLGLSVAAAQISPARECDENHTGNCSRDQYCDFHASKCKDCKVLCEKNLYDCIDHCKEHTVSAFNVLRGRVSLLLAVIYVLVVVMVLIVIGLIVIIFKLKRESFRCPQLPWQKKSPTTPTVTMNPNTNSPKGAPKNGANLMRQNTQQTTVSSITPERGVGNSVQTEITTISNRYPAEDSTEGLSYVNHACNVSATSNNSAPRY